jgi:DNA-binding response OmpR family regulator
MSQANPRRVLVVDDNTDAADSMAALLEMMGHTARVLYSGDTVAQEAQAWQPDCVLLDIGLPGKDGYEVARELRAQGYRASLVALTGWGGEDDRRRAADAGFDRHLTKPVEFDALETLLGELQG